MPPHDPWQPAENGAKPQSPAASECSARTLFINGRFATQPTTGVQRFAGELVRALDEHFDRGGVLPGIDRCVLLVPTPASAARLSLRRIIVEPLPFFSGHAWEQVALPWRSRGHLLLNLAGSAPLLKAKQACTFHDAAVFDHPESYRPSFVRWYRFLFRVQSRVSRPLLTVSAFSRDRLSRTLGVDPRTFRVVPNGVDHVRRWPSGSDVPERLGLVAGSYFLAVGSANPTKNFSALVRAFKALPNAADAKLVIVGGVNAAVFAAGGPASTDPRIVQAGRVDDAGLRALYERALAFVFPSTYEGFGIPPLEAMACGCPVIAARMAAMPETCGEAALYVDPRDDADLVRGLDRIRHDARLRRELIALGGRRAASFTWKFAAQRLVDHLSSPAATVEASA